MSDKRVLIVDDEKLITWSLAAMLRKEGYEIDTAASGNEALAKFGAAGLPQIIHFHIDELRLRPRVELPLCRAFANKVRNASEFTNR